MNAPAPAPPPLPAREFVSPNPVEEIRFRTTRWDLYWSLNHRLLMGRGSIIILLVIWAWSTFETAEKFLEADASTTFKVIAVCAAAFTWGLFLILLQFVVAAFMTMFMRGDGLVCEHTLRLLPEGLEEETNVNRSLQKYPVVDGMSKIWGFWVVRAAGGNAFIFRPEGVVSGDAAKFAQSLQARLK